MVIDMDSKFAIALSLGALLGMPELSEAGPLARTGRAIDNKSGASDSSNKGSSGSSSGSTSSPPPKRERPDRSSSRGNYGSSSSSSSVTTATYIGGSAYCDGCTNESPPLRLPVPKIDIGFGAQKVRGSDGSFRLDASMRFGRLGLYTSGDYYFEAIHDSGEPKTMMESRSENVRVNLFELAALGRLLDSKSFVADVHAGLGVAASSVFETLPGTAVGIKLEARASDDLSLRFEGRAMALKHNTRALEGATGLQWRELWVGYRALQFDVGEVLQGPEAGLRFRF